jgi:hypothetical protein
VLEETSGFLFRVFGGKCKTCDTYACKPVAAAVFVDIVGLCGSFRVSTLTLQSPHRSDSRGIKSPAVQIARQSKCSASSDEERRSRNAAGAQEKLMPVRCAC